MRSTTTRAAALAAGLFCLLAGTLTAVAPTASAAAGDVTVTWPEITAFNPDAYTYTVHIEMNGDGPVYLAPDLGTVQKITATGDYPVSFQPNRVTSVRVEDCPNGPGGACSVLAESPRLTEYNRISLLPPSRLGPNAVPDVRVTPRVPMNLTWDVTTLDGTSVYSGHADHVRLPEDLHPWGNVPELTDGQTYWGNWHVSLDGPEWGGLEGGGSERFGWDATPPAVPKVSVNFLDPRTGSTDIDGIVYPVRDRYGDTVDIGVTPPDGRPLQGDYASIVIRDAAGGAVFTGPPDTSAYYPYEFEWDGRDPSGAVVPEGTYEIDASYYDEAGNESNGVGEVVVSHARRHVVSWRGQVSAVASLVDEQIGGCGRLKKNPVGATPGALGLRSRTHCLDPTDSFATTIHQLAIPDAPLGSYRGMQLSFVGGHTPGYRGSRLFTQVLGQNGYWGYLRSYNGVYGTHFDELIPDELVIFHQNYQNAYVRWSATVSGGDRYDIEKFAVKVRYDVLEEPDGSIVS